MVIALNVSVAISGMALASIYKDGNRDSQSDNMLRVRDLGPLTSKKDVSIKPLYSGLWELSRRETR